MKLNNDPQLGIQVCFTGICFFAALLHFRVTFCIKPRPVFKQNLHAESSIHTQAWLFLCLFQPSRTRQTHNNPQACWCWFSAELYRKDSFMVLYFQSRTWAHYRLDLNPTSTLLTTLKTRCSRVSNEWKHILKWTVKCRLLHHFIGLNTTSHTAIN